MRFAVVFNYYDVLAGMLCEAGNVKVAATMSKTVPASVIGVVGQPKLKNGSATPTGRAKRYSEQVGYALVRERWT